MKTIDFKKMLKSESPKKIIALYSHNKLYLTNKQLQTVIDLKNELERR